jgi:hypothetical protein
MFIKLVFFFPSLIFAFYSLFFLRRVNSGSTIIVNPQKPLTTFMVVSGKISLTKSQKSQGFIISFNGPIASAFLGLLLFSASESLLVMILK